MREQRFDRQGEFVCEDNDRARFILGAWLVPALITNMTLCFMVYFIFTYVVYIAGINVALAGLTYVVIPIFWALVRWDKFYEHPSTHKIFLDKCFLWGFIAFSVLYFSLVIAHSFSTTAIGVTIPFTIISILAWIAYIYEKKHRIHRALPPQK